jgi:hypothetical protein
MGALEKRIAGEQALFLFGARFHDDAGANGGAGSNQEDGESGQHGYAPATRPFGRLPGMVGAPGALQ